MDNCALLHIDQPLRNERLASRKWERSIVGMVEVSLSRAVERPPCGGVVELDKDSQTCCGAHIPAIGAAEESANMRVCPVDDPFAMA